MSEAPPSPSRWYYSVWFILLMLFFVLGPFALPLLWKSDQFPRWSKWAITVLLLAMFIWITIKAFEIARTTIERMEQLF